ncbi:thiamine pyrophosphate-binding protein [Micromonospora radicis]|nr:thiamine pyrophosphate-binding protein [Micromonospora radicis]
MPPTVADTMLDVLRDWGIDRIFSCPGSTEAAVLDALTGRTDPRLVLTTHESVAVSMADGLARATGNPTVAYLHANVGLTNGLSHLYAAQLAHSPVVVLNGVKHRSVQSHDGFTTARRMAELVQQYVKSAWQSQTAQLVPEEVNRAIRASVTEPVGPVWLALAQDLLEQRWTGTAPDVSAFRFECRGAPAPDAVRAAADLIRAAERPLLVAGNEVARSDAVDGVVRLSERCGIPVLHEELRSFERPGFPTDHPHFRGRYHPQHPLVRAADVIVFLGVRLFNEFEPPTSPQIPPAARVVHAHPDPRRLGELHGVDVALTGDQELVVSALLTALPDTPTRQVPPRPGDEPRPTGGPRTGRRLRTTDVIEVLTDVLRDHVLVADATTAGDELQRRAVQRGPEDFFTTGSGSLGWGMGAALGVQLGLPHRRVAAIVGDGVFQFGIPALWSAARDRIPVTYVVLNNEGYAAVGRALRRLDGRAVRVDDYPGVDIAGPRIAEVSTAMGVPGSRVETLTELRERLVASRDVEHPVLVEVMTDPAEFRGHDL